MYHGTEDSRGRRVGHRTRRWREHIRRDEEAQAASFNRGGVSLANQAGVDRQQPGRVRRQEPLDHFADLYGQQQRRIGRRRDGDLDWTIARAAAECGRSRDRWGEHVIDSHFVRGQRFLPAGRERRERRGAGRGKRGPAGRRELNSAKLMTNRDDASIYKNNAILWHR